MQDQQQQPQERKIRYRLPPARSTANVKEMYQIGMPRCQSCGRTLYATAFDAFVALHPIDSEKGNISKEEAMTNQRRLWEYLRVPVTRYCCRRMLANKVIYFNQVLDEPAGQQPEMSAANRIAMFCNMIGTVATPSLPNANILGDDGHRLLLLSTFPGRHNHLYLTNIPK